MKTHSSQGYEILKNITIFPDLALGAEYHHERMDGRGYPSGLKGDAIPEIARIIAVADTFDAMHSTRPYRKKMEMSKIIAEIKRCSGTQLDPKVVEVFLQLAEEGAFDEPSENTPFEENANTDNNSGSSEQKPVSVAEDNEKGRSEDKTEDKAEKKDK